MYNSTPYSQGRSSNGRTAVSKTDGWEFESLRPCQLLKKNSNFSLISFSTSLLIVVYVFSVSTFWISSATVKISIFSMQ